MQNFDLLDFLSRNYISLGALASQNMWRSYCYGDPNIWWWHLQEETEMPFGGTTTYYFAENNRYRVSVWWVTKNVWFDGNTLYLYVEDLKLSKVHVYVSTLWAKLPVNDFLKTNTKFQNLRIELLDDNYNVFHSYTWSNNMTLLKGYQIAALGVYNALSLIVGLFNSLLIFDSNEALLYLHDRLHVIPSDEVSDFVIHFVAFSSQSSNISGIEYSTSEVTSMNDSARLYEGLNNTHTYIANMRDNISKIKITKNHTYIISNVINKSSSDIVRPLDNNYPWLILFVFRPTPVIGDDPRNYDVALPIEQNFTGTHSPITRWKLDNGYSLSINCSGVFTDIFLHFVGIPTSSYSILSAANIVWGSLHVISDIDLSSVFTMLITSGGRVIEYFNNMVSYRTSPASPSYSCGILITSLFHYYGDNTENLIWLFHYNSNNNRGTAYVIYSQNMDEYTNLITGDYIFLNHYILCIYNEILTSDSSQVNVQSYLSPYDYYNHVTSLFIYNTLAHTAPQIVNGSWSYMHYMRFVLDDYTSSNLRIPLAIVEGDIRRNNIKHREMQIDKMTISQRYPIVQLSSLSKAQMPDVVLDGYIASLNADAGKKEDSSFGTIIPYYDLKETQIQEPHPEWYFRIHIHAGTWYYIFKDITSNTSSNQMKTYRIQHNEGSLRIVLDVGLYFEIITETKKNPPKKYTIVYADIFPSVYWCYGNESYEFLNVNVEWIQCRYSMPGRSMVRARPNNNVVIIRRPEIF